MITEIHTLTPVAAALLLKDCNVKNARRMSPRAVAQYAEDMRGGRWQTTHQSIAFTGAGIKSPGILVDGQHRLAAIASLDFPVALSITFNAPNVPKIDFGMKRGLSIVTGINKNDLAACNVILSAIFNGTPTPGQKEELNREFPSLGKFRDFTDHNTIVTRSPVFAAFAVAEAGGLSTAETWYRELVNNDPAMPQPLHFLRLKLERDHGKMFSTVSKRIPAYAATLRALDAAKCGGLLQKLYTDKIFDNLADYDGRVGEFVRSKIKRA